MYRFLAKQPKLRDVDNSGVGLKGARADSATLLVITKEADGGRSPLNMNDGKRNLIGTDFDIYGVKASESIAQCRPEGVAINNRVVNVGDGGMYGDEDSYTVDPVAVDVIGAHSAK